MASAQINPSHIFEGSVAGDRHGTTVAGVQDLDGDGHDDTAVGTPLADTTSGLVTVVNSGNVTVYSGATGLVLWSIDGGNAHDSFGQSVVGVGDLDNDGTPDVAVGAPSHDVAGSYSGQVRVLSGVDGSDILVIDGLAAGERLGQSLAAPGDVDQDGTDDLLIGAHYATSTTGDAIAGVARVFSGATGAVIWAFEGDAPGDQLGHAVAAAGDVDQDGVPDLAMGAYRHNIAAGSYAGRIRVHSGVDGSLVFAIDGSTPGDWFGWALAGTPDVDGDGRDDIVVGSPYDGTAATNAGSVQVLSGLDGSLIWRRDGTASGDNLGYSVASLGDFDGDGVSDIGAGAPEGGTSLGASGYVMIMSSAGGTLLATLPGDVAGDRFGASVAGAGDIDMDGTADIVMGATHHDLDPSTTMTGRVRVFVQVVIVPPLTLTAPASVDLGNSIVFTITSIAPITPLTGYLLDVSLTGDSPGVPLPAPLFGVLPLNPPFLFQTTGVFWPSAFSGFAGHLDVLGQGTATLTPPLYPWFVNETLHAAAITLDPTGPMGIGVVSNGTATLVTEAAPAPTAIVPASGLSTGAYSATITGTGFLPGAAVTFGTTPATAVVVLGATTLTCDVPVGMPATVDVIVTNPGGTQGTLAAAFTWTSNVLSPVVTTVSPNHAPVSGGVPITITGQDFALGATVDVAGSPATNVVVVSSSEITCVTPPGVLGTAVITVTNPGAANSATRPFTYIADLLIKRLSSNYAMPGATVIVHGEGLDRISAVTVGGTPVQPQGATSTQFQFTCPTGGACANTVSVTATTGQVYSVPFNVPPTITAVTLGSGPTAGGGIFIVVGTGLSQVSITVGGNPATIQSPGESAVIATAPPQLAPGATGPAVPGPVTLTVSTPSGCSVTDTYTYY